MSLLNKLIVISIVLCSACMPGEEAVEPFPRGEVKEGFIDAGSLKNTVVFYNLELDSVVARTAPETWDIHFWNGSLFINYFRSVKVGSFNEELATKTDTQQIDFDHLQLADDQWQCKQDSHYVVDMGLNSNGSHMGYYKFEFKINGDKLDLSFGKLNEASLTIVQLQDGDYYSLYNESFTDLPQENEYDLSFGKYSHYFQVEQIDYEVYGAVSLNASQVKTDMAFAAIEANIADTITWSSRYDEIGYDWKYYSLDKGAYEIDDKANYVLMNRNGFIYKLRFTNFYNSQGTSGHPSFEYELL